MSSTSRARRHARHSLVTLFALALAAVSCSGSGTGCAGMTPIPSGRYQGPKNDNAINIRLSPNGINYLNTHWQTLISAFAPGNTLTLPVNCMTQSVDLAGLVTITVAIADQGMPGCNAESCGSQDGVCTTSGSRADSPANVVATITGFSLIPQAPDRLQASIQLSVDTSAVKVASESENFLACLGLSRMKCSVRFNTRTVLPNDNRIRATVQFTIDTKWDKLLAFQVTSFTGSDVCGASGAPPPPDCLQPQDITLAGQNTCGNIYCDTADLDIVKTTLLQLISPLLQSQIRTIIGDQTCEPCMATADCPRSTDGTNQQATCSNDICRDTVANKCVPRFLGVEGRIDLGGVLGSFGAPAGAQMDLSLAAGSSVTVDQGLSLGTRVGIQPVQVAGCVPPTPAPAMTAVTAPNFDGEATPGSQFHVGLGLSTNFLNIAFHSAHQAGALCLQLSTENVGLINTGLFKTFLPSLGRLASRDGKDAPMMVVLRPARPPQVSIGQGTYDPVTKKPIKPLILLTLPELSIDFYAMIDDRQARLFTLTADISLPLSLIFEGCDKVTPAIGDLKMLISNIRTANSEMLAEDPQVLADLVPAIIGLAEPAVASALKPFSLPSLGNFKLKVNEAKGVGNIAGTEAYNHLGIYAQLLGANEMCAVSAPRLTARLEGSRMPKAEEMRATGQKKLPWPEAVLAVDAQGKAGSPEYAVRIDDGLWSDFRPAVNGQLSVSHPRFLLQGAHTIWVRTRVAEDPQGISPPQPVGFLVDWEGPEVSVAPNRETDRLEVKAWDAVSHSSKLLFAYRVGAGETSDFGPAREISLSAVEQQGGVTVLAKDELGNVGQAVWRAPTVVVRPDVPTQPGSSVPSVPQPGGCAAVDGVSVLGLLAVIGLLRRRR
ncbi:MAG: hypothetical protein AB1938_02540 [Myxococcota bacterium]